MIDALVPEAFEEGAELMRQGQLDADFAIVASGACVMEVAQQKLDAARAAAETLRPQRVAAMVLGQGAGLARVAFSALAHPPHPKSSAVRV